MRRNADPPTEMLVEPLTRREREVLALLAEGLTSPEIAERLTLAVSTVKSHVQQVYGKLGVNSKRQALVRAKELGLLGTPLPVVHTEPPPAPQHNLPLQLATFIGREKEIAGLKKRLAEYRLVTLTGSGGIGKTRLSIQAARELVPRYPDGVWLVELAPLADPALVPQTVCVVLDVQPQGNIPPLTALTDYLREKTLLLVLDNCEHLIDACAQLSEHLLTHCPDVCLLASSREALGIEGETSLRVPSLSLPDTNRPSSETLQQSEAVRLFVERATAALPGFALTDANAPAIAQVCHRLDGIALAIELAAARVKVLKVEQIATRLDDAFRLLTGGSRTALPRQQTLRATIDWSYSLLSDAERVLLRRLAVFAGGWTLEAAEAIGAGETIEKNAVLDLLTQLANKSLVVVEREQGKEARYFLLETTRQYTHEKLQESDEGEALRRRHAEYYLALVEADFQDENVWDDRYRVELDNLRAALTWSNSATGGAELGLRLAAGMTSGIVNIMEPSEWRGWLEGVLTHAEAEGVYHPPALARVLRGLGMLGNRFLDFVAAQVRLTHSLRLFQALGDRPNSAVVLYTLGLVARELGDPVTARLHLEECLALYRELSNQRLMAEALFSLGEVAVMEEDAAPATALIEEGLVLKRRLEDSYGIGWGLHHLGHVMQLQGNYKRAMQLQEEALALARGIEQPDEFCITETNFSLGEATLARGDVALAKMYFRKSLTLSRHLQIPRNQIWCLAGLAGVAAVNKEPTRAAKLWGAAAGLRQSIGLRPGPATRATHERLQAEAYAQLGEATFNAAWAEGQTMTLEQAGAYALATDDDAPLIQL